MPTISAKIMQTHKTSLFFHGSLNTFESFSKLTQQIANMPTLPEGFLSVCVIMGCESAHKEITGRGGWGGGTYLLSYVFRKLILGF